MRRLPLRWRPCVRYLCWDTAPQRALCTLCSSSSVARSAAGSLQEPRSVFFLPPRRHLSFLGGLGPLGQLLDLGHDGGGVSQKITRQMPCSAQSLFNVVADVARYSEYLPFMERSVLLTAPQQVGPDRVVFQCRFSIGFRAISSSYSSEVTCDTSNLTITSRVLGGELFQHNVSVWRFEPDPHNPQRCTVHFTIEFEVSNPLHKHTLGLFLHDVSERQVAAFQRRVQQIYPPSQHTLHTPSPQQQQQQQGVAPAAASAAAQQKQTLHPPAASHATPAQACPSQAWLVALLEAHERFATGGVAGQVWAGFSPKELDKLKQSFGRHAKASPTSNAQVLDQAGFQALCKELMTRDSLFSRFTHRFEIMAIAENKAVAESLFSLLSASARVEELTADVLVPHFFFLTKANFWEKFEYAIYAHSRATGAWEGDPLPTSLPFSVLKECTIFHFDQQLRVIRHILPGLVNREAVHEEEEGVIAHEDLLLHEISLLGAMDDLLDDTRDALDESLAKLAEHFKASKGQDPAVNLSDWMERWHHAEHARLLDVTTVRGMAALVHLFATLGNAIPAR